MYWVAQICGWSIYSLLIYFSATIDRPTEISSNLHLQLVFMTVFNIFFTHIMRLYMLRNNWLDKKLAQLLPRLIIISIICSAFIECCLLVSEYFLSDNFYNDLKPAQVIINILALTLLIISWNGIYFTYHFFQKSRVKELENVTLEASKNEIELKNLRSQLNPHFLFNSLNSIRALVDIEPQNAKNAITTLSNLLRKSLVSGKENLIPVSEEVEIVKSYLDLEKIRFEERLTIDWQLDERCNSFLLPPFIIQTLVENAIKHGISQQINGGFIRISIQKKNGKLLITVENTGQLNNSVDSGIGIANTERRLAIQFKDKAAFSLQQLETTVVATLTFDYEEN